MANSKRQRRISYSRHYATTPVPMEQEARIERLLARLVAKAIFAEQQALPQQQSTAMEIDQLGDTSGI